MSNLDEDDLDALLNQYEQQAQQDIAKVTNNTKKKSTKSHTELLQENLATALPADNKGFQLLSKLGYKPGQGIGAAGREGRVEPLKPELRAVRSGLGAPEAKRQKVEQAEREKAEKAARHVRTTLAKQQDFKLSRAQLFAQREARRHMHAAQQACQTLDEASSVERHDLWPPLPPEPQTDQNKTDTQTAPDSSLQDGHCRGGAGSSRNTELHAVVEAWNSAEMPFEGEVEEEEDPVERLQRLVTYLRDAYFYCVFCGIKFDNADNMQQECPGPDADDH